MKFETYQLIITWLGLSGLWAIWNFLWKPQRVDIFRQRLFALRAELFDLAADGDVEFSDPAYTRLRFLLNGMIQYAHRISLPLVLLSFFLIRNASETSRPDWEAALPNVSENVRHKLLSVHERMADAFSKQLIYGSITLGCFFCLLTLFKFARFGTLLLVGMRTPSDLSVASSKGRLASVAASLRQTVTRTTRTQVAVMETRMLQEDQFRRSLNPLAQVR